MRTHLFYPPDLVGIHWPLGLCAFRRTGVDCAKERIDTVMKTPQNMDDLPLLAEICRQYELWFHLDGAYGGTAAAVPEAPPELRGLSLADSVAIDPPKG